MWLILAFTMCSYDTFAAVKKVKDPCEKILAELQRIQDGKISSNTYMAMLRVTVKPAEHLPIGADRDRLDDQQLRNFAVAARVSNFDDLPLGFQILWLKIWDLYRSESPQYWSVPHVWRTPAHWYDEVPEVFPPGHREIERIDSRTQVISVLDQNLWRVIEENRDLIENVELYTIPRKFIRALNQREKKASRADRFRLKLTEASGQLVATFEIYGASAAVFDEDIQAKLSDEAPWAEWDTVGGQEPGQHWELVYENHSDDLTFQDKSAWVEWIERAIKKQGLKWNKSK